MAASKLVLADAAAIKTMYDAAIPGIQAFWPGSVVSFPLATWQQYITEMGGWKSVTSNQLRGFLLTPRRPEPLTNLDAEEVFLWIVPASSSNALFASTTKELFGAWWNDLLSRGIPRGWGYAVPTYPARSETWFMNAVTKASMTLVTRPRGGIDWRIVVFVPATAVAALNQL